MESYSNSTTRLSLLISPPSEDEEDSLTPPHTAVSVPFKWEEVPGKPRKCHTQSEPDSANNNDHHRTLELPPRLLFSCNNKVSNLDVAASPTTVLAGPYVGRAMSFTSSYRTPRDYRVSNFGSARWTGSRKITEEDDHEGDFDFSPTPMLKPNVKIGRNHRARRQSSLSLSHQSKGSSHFWAGIYESFKQMVPWKRRHQQQQKHTKWT